jgi:hypothetical protein
MKTAINFVIDCGEKTCATEPGKFCKFFGTKKFGIIPVCVLFPSDIGAFTVLREGNGLSIGSGFWTLRCNECLKHGEKQ